MISRTGRYAVWAVVHLAEAGPNAHNTVAQVARATHLPASYLAKIFHTLVRCGVLDSSRGRHGGFRLAQPPDRLTLAAVLAPFEQIPSRGCVLAGGRCPHQDRCRSWRECRGLSRHLTRFIRDTRIADLVGDAGSGPT